MCCRVASTNNLAIVRLPVHPLVSSPSVPWWLMVVVDGGGQCAVFARMHRGPPSMGIIVPGDCPLVISARHARASSSKNRPIKGPFLSIFARSRRCELPVFHTIVSECVTVCLPSLRMIFDPSRSQMLEPRNLRGFRSDLDDRSSSLTGGIVRFACAAHDAIDTYNIYIYRRFTFAVH